VNYKLWFIAARPWTYTAAVIPVTLGAVLAVAHGYTFDFILFLLTLVGGICMQGAANFLNTYGDYVSGVDSEENASCPQLVNGDIRPNAMRNAGIISLLLGVLLGLYPVYCGGLPVLICGAIGFIGAACYTTGFFPYKYVGLGSIFVFFLMGPLMVIPSWYIQGGEGILIPMLGSIPISFLVMAILHGNELRDIEFDQKKSIVTLAIRLGLKKSIVLYKCLFFSAFFSLLILLLCTDVFSRTTICVFILIPFFYKRICKLSINSSSELIRWLAKQTGKSHLIFGTLLIFAEIISLFCKDNF
jgi:1,4-dihydroxy-2-naphthoate octaprenyltransferase